MFRPVGSPTQHRFEGRVGAATHADLARRLNELEQKYDEQFRVVFEAIRELMTDEEVPPSRRIGFSAE